MGRLRNVSMHVTWQHPLGSGVDFFLYTSTLTRQPRVFFFAFNSRESIFLASGLIFRPKGPEECSERAEISAGALFVSVLHSREGYLSGL